LIGPNRTRFEIILASGTSQAIGRLKNGLYDQLITPAVRDALAEQNEAGVNASIDELEESDSPDYLARHLARQIKIALRGLSGEERKRRQIELANGLLNFIQTVPTASRLTTLRIQEESSVPYIPGRLRRLAQRRP
jgi:hypothetical protein